MHAALGRVVLSPETSWATELEALEKKWRRCGLEKDSTYARILHLLGRNYWKTGNLDAGIEFTQKSIRINSSGSEQAAEKELCNSFFNLGAIYAQKGMVNECLEAYGQSIAVGIKYPEKLLNVSKIYKELASVLFGQGDLEKSALAGEKGFRIAQQLNDPALMSANLVERAQALLELGSLEEARLSLEKVLELNTGNHAYLGAAHSLYAELNVRLNQFRQAVSHYEKSFAGFERSGFDYGCGQSSLNLGYLHAEKLGDPDLALKYYRRALDYYRIPQDRAVVINSLARIKNNTGLPEEALLLNRDALKEFLPNFTGGGPYVNPDASAIRQVVYKNKLLELVVQKGEILLRLHEKKPGDRPLLTSALSCYMLADTMVDFMRWEHTGTASKLFWREKTRELYENAIKASFLLGDAGKAFYFFEKSRAALLQDQLKELGAARLLQPTEQAKENELKNKVKRLQKELADLSGDDARKSAILAALFDAGEELQRFVKGLETTNPAYYSYKYDHDVPTISRLYDEILEPDQGFLSYFIGDSAVYGFFCHGSHSQVRKIDLRSYSEALAEYERYLSGKELQNQDFNGYIRASNRLYRLLVEPFSIDPGVRLVISPDGRLLPFAALSQSGEKEAFLVRSNPVSYTYSASYLARSARKKRSGFSLKNFFGMAPVDFAPSLKQPSLSGSDLALRTLEKRFVFSKCLEKQEATKGAFLRNIAQYSIVQLFTHASADTAEKGGSSPTLYFADSALKIADLEIPFQNATELLVLSACETGTGTDLPGEGVFSLARGFAGAGIPSVLTTLWKVENQAVYEITDFFYEGIGHHLPLDEALREAQLKWLDTGEKSEQLPYVWAGSVLIGDTGNVSTGWSPFQARAAAVSGLALSGIFFLLRRRKTGIR